MATDITYSCLTADEAAVLIPNGGMVAVGALPYSIGNGALADVSSVRQWSGKQDDAPTVLICDYTPGIDDCGTAVRSGCQPVDTRNRTPAIRRNYGAGLAERTTTV